MAGSKRDPYMTFLNKDIIPRLEAADYIFRYSWFISRYNEKDQDGDWYVDTKNGLLKENSTELTEVGRIYNSL